MQLFAGGFAFCQDGEKTPVGRGAATGSPHGTGAGPSTLLLVPGWVGALRGKGCPGGLHRVWRGAGGAMGTDGPVRGEQGGVGHGGALQEGIQLPREPVAARTVPSPGAGAGPGVSSPRQLHTRSAPMHGVAP